MDHDCGSGLAWLGQCMVEVMEEDLLPLRILGEICKPLPVMMSPIVITFKYFLHLLRARSSHGLKGLERKNSMSVLFVFVAGCRLGE